MADIKRHAEAIFEESSGISVPIQSTLHILNIGISKCFQKIQFIPVSYFYLPVNFWYLKLLIVKLNFLELENLL